jgi:hypothetical protein
MGSRFSHLWLALSVFAASAYAQNTPHVRTSDPRIRGAIDEGFRVLLCSVIWLRDSTRPM